MQCGLRLCLLFFVLIANSIVSAQRIGGPMLGPVELRTAKIWIEVKPGSTVDLWYWKQGAMSQAQKISRNTASDQWFAPITFFVTDLQPSTVYEYQFLINRSNAKKPYKADGTFATKDLWQHRKPAPDFKFLTGSCAFFNDPSVDRPGKPYGGDSSIFQTMALDTAAFMLWMGDNWYTREVDYFDEWGLWSRASHDRSMPVLQPFLKSTAHIAIWDDHDYGPNDIGKHYVLKHVSRDVFTHYWVNPSSGQNGQGIYTMYSYSDVDFFLMDDRWWRCSDQMKDSIDGKPNPEKEMWGKAQMDWLKNALLYSKATFKIIVNGSQILNSVSPYDKLRDFPAEYDALMDFLTLHSINGVLFFSGDRHHSEIIKTERTNRYPLYDITVSPLTSGTHAFGGPERNNPYRVLGLDQQQNYGRVSVTGSRGHRLLSIEFMGVKGNVLKQWSITEGELKTPR
jgi:alkaline phosphatase D